MYTRLLTVGLASTWLSSCILPPRCGEYRIESAHEVADPEATDEAWVALAGTYPHLCGSGAAYEADDASLTVQLSPSHPAPEREAAISSLALEFSLPMGQVEPEATFAIPALDGRATFEAGTVTQVVRLSSGTVRVTDVGSDRDGHTWWRLEWTLVYGEPGDTEYYVAEGQSRVKPG